LRAWNATPQDGNAKAPQCAEGRAQGLRCRSHSSYNPDGSLPVAPSAIAPQAPHIRQHPNKIAIIRAVTAMSISLGMKTTAEGVETEEELQTLKEEGCTEVQGYLFSKPVPAAQAAKLLQSLKAMKAVA
jgi:hypothetical protein